MAAGVGVVADEKVAADLWDVTLVWKLTAWKLLLKRDATMSLSIRWFAFSLVAVLATSAQGADKPAKPTHVLQPTMLEVAPARENGNAWDTGIGAFARPDAQVTLMRNDAAALKEAAGLLEKAMERRMTDLGRPVPPQFKGTFEKNAIQSLRCGRSLEALKDEALNKARARFMADTAVASDTILAKLTDGGLRVAMGDRVTVFVNDVDLAAHDVMGQQELEITKDLLTKGETELKFNSVESLRLKLVPIAE
jgi:hypothetical protein